MSQTLGQQRAAYCLEKLQGLTCDRDEFKKLSAGLPAMILQNGFGQTLAFLQAKGQGKHLAAFQIMAGWLVDRQCLTADRPAGILTQVSRMEQRSYLYAQKETLAMLEWLKRYANAALFEE